MKLTRSRLHDMPWRRPGTIGRIPLPHSPAITYNLVPLQALAVVSDYSHPSSSLRLLHFPRIIDAEQWRPQHTTEDNNNTMEEEEAAAA